jgi:hypothetical protein
MSGTNNAGATNTPPSVTSTNYDATYSRTKVVNAILANQNGQQTYVTEFFAMNLIRLIRAMPLISIARLGGMPITSQANKLYGNTTCYWMICFINGFGSYLCVPENTLIGYPDVTVLQSLNNITAGVNLNQSNVTI